MKYVILLCGVAKSGKDTLFPFIKDHLEETMGGTWKRFAFADKLKRDCEDAIRDLYDVSVWDDSKKDIFRQHLINHGMKRREETNGRYLIDPLVDQVNNNDDNIIVTDYRFIDEYRKYGEAKVIPIYLQRVLYQGAYDFVIEPTIQQEIDNYYVIRNHPDIITLQVPWVADLRFGQETLKSYVSELQISE